MKKVFIFLFIILFSFNVKAGCTSEELDMLLEEGKNVDYTLVSKLIDYDHFDQEYNLGLRKYVTYSLQVFNLTNNIKAYAKYPTQEENEINYFTKNNNKQNDFEGGKLYLYVMSNHKNCPDRQLKKIVIDLEYYNNFYESDECKENKEFKYCLSEYINDYVDIDIFEKELEKYKKEEEEKNKEQEIKQQEEKKKEKKSQTKKIIIIALISIISILIIIKVVKTIANKRNERNRVWKL